MIISFAFTEKEFLAGLKTVTRRRWKPRTAKQFRAGSIHYAWSKVAFAPGARKLATIRAVQDAYQERLGDITESELLAEGGMCKTVEEFCRLFGGDPNEIIWVARFEIMEANTL